MTINDLVNATKPIIYETGNQEWPYCFSGTCYPVKYDNNLFIVSAFHCYKNFKIEPENTLYPRPDDATSFLAFDLKSRARANAAKDNEHYDQVTMRVAKSHHSQNELDKVVALDLAKPANWLIPTNADIKDIVIRGYPHDAPKHGIDYDMNKITQQAYMTNGLISVAPGPYDLCYSIKMKTPIPDGMHPNGMSGSPVYGITKDGRPVYCGTLIRYNTVTKEYIAIGPEILANSLKETLL